MIEQTESGEVWRTLEAGRPMWEVARGEVGADSPRGVLGLGPVAGVPLDGGASVVGEVDIRDLWLHHFFNSYGQEPTSIPGALAGSREPAPPDSHATDVALCGESSGLGAAMLLLWCSCASDAPGTGRHSLIPKIDGLSG